MESWEQNLCPRDHGTQKEIWWEHIRRRVSPNQALHCQCGWVVIISSTNVDNPIMSFQELMHLPKSSSSLDKIQFCVCLDARELRPFYLMQRYIYFMWSNVNDDELCLYTLPSNLKVSTQASLMLKIIIVTFLDFWKTNSPVILLLMYVLN